MRRHPKHRKEKTGTLFPPLWAGAVVVNMTPSDQFVPPVMNVDGPPDDS